MSRHAAAWTGGRIFADRFIGRTIPGKHHPIWEADLGLQSTPHDNMDGLNEWTRTPGGGLINQTDFDYMAHAMFGARK